MLREKIDELREVVGNMEKKIADRDEKIAELKKLFQSYLQESCHIKSTIATQTKRVTNPEHVSEMYPQSGTSEQVLPREQANVAPGGGVICDLEKTSGEAF